MAPFHPCFEHESLYCLVDFSGSMRAWRKLKIAQRLINELNIEIQQFYGYLPQTSLKVFTWQHEISALTPETNASTTSTATHFADFSDGSSSIIPNVNNSETFTATKFGPVLLDPNLAQGQASLSALKNWLYQLTKNAKPAKPLEPSTITLAALDLDLEPATCAAPAHTQDIPPNQNTQTFDTKSVIPQALANQAWDKLSLPHQALDNQIFNLEQNFNAKESSSANALHTSTNIHLPRVLIITDGHVQPNLDIDLDFGLDLLLSIIAVGPDCNLPALKKLWPNVPILYPYDLAVALEHLGFIPNYPAPKPDCDGE